MDDYFNEETYTPMYIEHIGLGYGKDMQQLSPGDYRFSSNVLYKAKDDIPALHFNHRLLYETVLQLKAKSTMEFGCGSGDHCHNLSVLNPKIKVYGCDLLKSQLSFSRKRNPELPHDTNFFQFDIRTPVTKKMPRVDIVFSQAVIMHINDCEGYLITLANMFTLAKKQVILMENWTTHNFLEDIKSLKQTGVISWPEIYYYFRRSPERKFRPHLMVISPVVLNPYFYETLNDFNIMVNNTAERVVGGD